MAKYFEYRRIRIRVAMTGMGTIEICGQSGKYDGFTTESNDTEIIDFCDEDTKKGQEMRRAAYNKLREYYNYYISI